MRDDFDQKTKEVLFRRARGRCSNPACRQDTSGAHSDPDKAINTGFAAHITAAAPGGPRYDPTLSAAQRKAAANGIWLCGICAKLIDSDPQKYRVELLQQWKQTAEAGDKREATIVSAPSGLPRAAAFVGRAETLEELLTDLRTCGAVGVFALGGMGGVGKTALAAEVVARLAEELQTFPGGAAWVACEDLYGDEGLTEVWTRVARALDASEVAALSDAEQRRGTLHALLARGTRWLLALDNVDGLEASLLLETLAVQGHTTLLLTARQVIDLPGLVARSLDVLPAADAEALFAQTLSRSSPREPRPTPTDLAVLPRLVADLGRLPLALELTATYAGRQGLALETVRREIEQDGVGSAPFLPAQHAQQRALMLRFDRSWQALTETPHRQHLFAALSLLKGDSFPRAAALVLAKTAGGEQATEASASAALAALVEYALVETLSSERYRLHPLLREYAAQKLKTLAPAQQERLGEAVVAYWRAYAEAHPGYEGMDALEAEAAGLIGALAWAHEWARHQEVLRLANALNFFLHVRGRMDEARLVRPWALEAAKALDDKEKEMWAFHHLAVLDTSQGRLSEAKVGYERALELAQQLGDLAVERREVHALALLDANQGWLSEARAGYERALVLARQLGDPAAEQSEVHELARLDASQGRLAEARAGYERALELAWQLGDPVAEQREVHGLAVLDANQGRLAEARAGYERALELARQLGNAATEGYEIHGLAMLDKGQGRLSAAQAGFERALKHARQVGDLATEAVELMSLGLLIGQRGEPEQGRKLITEALTISEQLNSIYYRGKAYQFLAWLDKDEGNRSRAIMRYREALRCFGQVQSPEVEGVRADLRRLGEVG